MFSHHFNWSDAIKWASKKKKRFGKFFQWLILSWVWYHPIYWIVNRRFVCTVCAQVIQSWGRGFQRGPSSGHCCLLYSLMNYAVLDMSLRLYADETPLYASDVSPIALQFVVNRGLSCLSEWFNANSLLINNAKTQALPIGPCKYDFDLTLNGSGDTKLPSIRILGVELDSMLNFIEHISSQLKKAYAKTAALRRIRPFVPMGVMLALYKSFILPHLEYCSPLLLGVGKVQANKIEDPNHYIHVLRTLTGHGKSLSYQKLLNICKLDTLECRKKQQSLILLFKCIRNIGPKYIWDFYSIREMSYNLRGNGDNLCIPKFNLNFMRNSFTYKCTQLWNKLPEDVKLADNVNIFKYKLRSSQL